MDKTRFSIHEIWNNIHRLNWPLDCVTQEGDTKQATFADFTAALNACGHNLLDFCMKYKALNEYNDMWTMCRDMTDTTINDEYSWNAEMILTVQYKLNEMEEK